MKMNENWFYYATLAVAIAVFIKLNRDNGKVLGQSKLGVIGVRG